MNHDPEQIKREILKSWIDDTTRVHMIKILEGNPSSSDIHVICAMLQLSERYKLKQKTIDTLMARNSNRA